ncbi:MAG: hypothetical protein K5907_09325 [Treponema sp.]|nr:hypothetical protein [Treponema sp.]
MVKQDSFIHRCPAWIKILLVPVISIVFFYVPAVVSAVMIGVFFVIQLVLGFKLREIFGAIQFVLYYAVILIIFRGMDVVPMLLRLICMLELAVLVFKTSTSLELRYGFETIELAVRKVFHLKRRTPVANALALFVSFIPLVSQNWKQSKRAWKARGGKNSIKMYVVLLPVFFSVGMKQAYLTARAVSIRAA